MKTKALLARLSKQFPKSIAIKWNDHVGHMTGKLPDEIHKILLCLDYDDEVYESAKKYMPDLIITHHPFIYGTKAKVFKWDKQKQKTCEDIDALGIPICSYHTNFDEGKGGMNDALASALGLNNIVQIETLPMMRGGQLEKAVPVEEFAKFAKEKLNVDYGLLIAKGKKNIKSVAIIGGGGSRYWTNAKDAGYDLYISGDAPHHVRRAITNTGYNYLDLPHEIEKIFMPTMKKILLGFNSSLDIVIVDHEKLPKVI